MQVTRTAGGIGAIFALTLGFFTPPGAIAADTPIQPGAQVTSSVGGCTLNFVFTDAAGALFIGTAGHCTKGPGERMVGQGGAFGTVVFRELQGVDDFALVQIDASQYGQVNPAVRRWGGPTGYTTPETTATGDQLLVSGYGIVFGSFAATRPRVGVLASDDADEYQAETLAVNGDSGGPLLHAATGKALGIISHYGLPLYTDKGPTIQRVLKRLDEVGYNLSLVTAPFTP